MSPALTATAALRRSWRAVCLPHLSALADAKKGTAAMTSSTTTRAAANGGTATTTTGTAPNVPAAREHGLGRFREDECYHLTELVLAALREAEHLVREVNTMAAGRFRDFLREDGTGPLDREKVHELLAEAYHCACAAVTYIDNAAERWSEDTIGPSF